MSYLVANFPHFLKLVAIMAQIFSQWLCRGYYFFNRIISVANVRKLEKIDCPRPVIRKQSFTTLNNRIYWHYAKLKN